MRLTIASAIVAVVGMQAPDARAANGSQGQTPGQMLEQSGITFRVGAATIAPSADAVAKLREAVDRHNASARLPGLPDDLNVVVLDPQKVEAFCSGLRAVPGETLDKLRGKVVSVNEPQLQLYAWTPFAAASLGKGFTLTVDESSSARMPRVRLEVPIDEPTATSRTLRAKEAMEQADAEAAVLAKRKEQPGSTSADFVAHSTALRKRYAAASVWRSLTAILAARHPDDTGLRQEAAKAAELASKYIVAPWTGMPR